MKTTPPVYRRDELKRLEDLLGMSQMHSPGDALSEVATDEVIPSARAAMFMRGGGKQNETHVEVGAVRWCVETGRRWRKSSVEGQSAGG